VFSRRKVVTEALKRWRGFAARSASGHDSLCSAFANVDLCAAGTRLSKVSRGHTILATAS